MLRYLAISPFFLDECERSHQISEVLLWSGIEQTTETDIRLNPRNRGSGDIRQLRLDWEQAKAKIAEHKGKYEIANMKVETFGKYTPLMPWNGDIVEVAAVQGGYMRGVWKSPQRLLRRDDCLSEACRVSP